MNPARSAYSIRSWPSSSRIRRFNRFFILGTGTRNGVDLAADVAVHAVDALTDLGDRSHRHQRDEPREERVFNQVLPFLFPNEPFHQSFHRAHSSRGEGMVRNELRLEFDANFFPGPCIGDSRWPGSSAIELPPRLQFWF